MRTYIDFLYEVVLRLVQLATCLIFSTPQRRNFRVHYATESPAPLKQALLRKKEERKNIILPYNPTSCDALRRFQHVVDNSLCIFAKRAKLWGCPNYNSLLSIEENVTAAIPALMKFASLEDDRLDGFVIEIRGEEYSCNVDAFAATVHRVLKHDPTGLDCIRMRSIETPAWYFSFCNMPIFVTTFAPCYPKTSARYMYATPENSDCCYVLLQPEASFAHHRIGPDTPHTNWEAPQTNRDKIRINFRSHNCPYFIPPTNSYPVANYIVPTAEPLQDGVAPQLIQFWKK